MDILEAIEAYNNRNGVTLEFKALLSDMDGVLYNSMPFHAKAWAETMQAEGVECEAREFYAHEGRTGKGTINIYFNKYKNREATEEEIQRIYAEKARRFVECGEAHPMRGAQEALQMIKGAGKTIVLVTGSGQKSLLQKLTQHYPNIFTPQTMVTAYDVVKGKPNPEPYLMGLQKAGVRNFEAIVLENAPLGVEAGRAAGIFTIAVNTGPLAEEELYEAGADIVYPDVETFTNEIKRILK
ncbi:MAG: HAD-IA family hydrolase [Bacteroidales bacterium]|nr:HAD-IA family hydrolase [Bacteroidales bacterium]